MSFRVPAPRNGPCKPWVRSRAVLAAAGVLLLAQTVATAATLTDMRQGVTPERTRLVLDFEGGDFAWQETSEADALVLRLRGTRQREGLGAIADGQGCLRDARVVEETGDDLLLRIRLREAAPVRVFRLPAEGGKPHRLVIDLQCAGAADVAGSASIDAAAPSETPIDPTPGPKRTGPRVVVIDPGHGGKDPGAVAPGLKEKAICLDVAERLEAILDAADDFDALRTRQTDTYLSLRSRLRFAEEKDADLFVSIHVNAAEARGAHGAEVFFLSLGAATDQASRELARLENEADPDYVVLEDADLKDIPFGVSLRQSDTLARSSRMGEVILDVFQEQRLAEVRGVKQAGFAVLKSFQVPSVLVELGFISSDRDRENLKSEEHRQKLAEALAEGILRYFRQYAPARAAASER